MTSEQSEVELPEKTGGSINFANYDIEEVRKVPAKLTELYRNIMHEGTDYGTIPGTKKPSLWKPGAELLARWLHLSCPTKIVEKTEEFDHRHPFFSYTAETKVYTQFGAYIGNGFGSANTRETQYAFKWVKEKDLPPGLDRSRLSKDEWGRYRVERDPDEVFALQNTVVKKAQKRAYVGAILSVTGASRIFTQDTNEGEDRGNGGKTDSHKVPVSREEVQYAVRDFGDLVEVTESLEDVRVILTTGFSQEDFAKIKSALVKLGGTYVPAKAGEKPSFSIKK